MTLTLRKYTTVLGLVVGLCLLQPSPSRGSIFDTYGFGSRGTAMGNALTAGALDFHAVYYNPAQLMERNMTHVGVGVSYIHPNLSIDRDLLTSDNPSILPGQNVGFTVGVSTPLGGVFKQKVALGFGMFIPLMRMTRAQNVDYGSPQFYNYENLPDKLIVALGAAVRPFPWLDIGIGTQILADLDGQGDVTLSLVEGKVTDRKMSIDLHGDLALTAGMTVRPMKGLSLAISYRESLDLAYSLPLYAEIKEIGMLVFDISGTSLYTPHQINVGVQYTIPEWNLSIASDLTYALWSLAPSPSPIITVNLDNSGLIPSADPQPLLDAESGPIDLEAKDVLIPRLGLEYHPISSLALRAGYSYRPTPLPTPIHQTNYADSDAHLTSVGLAWSFQDPTHVHKKPITIGLSAQWTILRPRRVDKADPNDATGSYTIGGSLLYVGLDIQHDF